MTSPSELSLEEIRRYLLAQGGSARNQDLVIYFKKFLTDPETRVEARNRFKEYINTLATIKTEEGEKFLVLKKKFRQASLDLSSPTLSFAQYPTSPLTPDLTTPTSPLKDLSLASPVRDPQPPSLKDHFKTPVRETIPPPVRGLALQSSPSRTPPPYRPPPVAPLSPLSNTTSPIRRFPVEPPIGLPLGIPIVEPAIQHVLPSSSSRYSESESESSNSSTLPPSVPPRRKSQDKIKFSNKENQGIIDKNKNASETIKEDAMSISSTTSATSSQQQQQPQMAQQQQQQQQKEQQQQLEQLSVKERMQRFNRLATETDLAAKAAAAVGVSSPPAAATSKKRVDKGTEEDDRASVASFLLPAQQQLDAKSREWLVRAAQGDYQALAKLAAEEPRLARTKDPSSGYTALHWGAKHGDENIIKLIAGTYRDYIKSVNETSNGGYTPLHIAVQFSHENIYNLLVQVYGANQDVRDYSGRKARQYSISQKAAVSQDTMRKIKARKKHAEKDLGFLRIGSLNVRVKRTTEAFSQFLGVTTNNAATSNEKIHKSWGSADHLPADQLMPPPKYGPIKKRRSRRATDFISSRSSTGNGGQSPGGTPPPSSHRRPSSVSTMMTSPLHEEQPPSPSSSTASGTNNQQQQNQLQSNHDSDSDGACGFDSRWHGQF